MDDAITAYVRRKYNLLIGEGTAERIKKEIGSAVITSESHLIVGQVSGQDVAQGMPREIRISQAEIAEALRDPISQVAQIVVASLDKAKPEIAADVIDRGITMTGGGSLLRNIDRVLAMKPACRVRGRSAPDLRYPGRWGGSEDRFRQMLCRPDRSAKSACEQLVWIREGFELQRIAGRVEEEHRRLFAGFSLKVT
jgi:hypothetical protein